MKTFILSVVVLCFLASCQKDEEVKPNPFVGSWSFASPEIELAFDVIQQGSILNYTNRRVIHPAIPEDQQANNQLTTFDKFANGNGYGMIVINSRGPVQYRVTMIYNRFTDEGMAVYDLQIDIPGYEFTVLQDVIIERSL